VIIDEGKIEEGSKGMFSHIKIAHNIEDSSRSAGSFEVNENELKILAIELNQIIRGGYEPQAHNHMLYVRQSSIKKLHKLSLLIVYRFIIRMGIEYG
jgi:hypothetical protein